MVYYIRKGQSPDGKTKRRMGYERESIEKV